MGADCGGRYRRKAQLRLNIAHLLSKNEILLNSTDIYYLEQKKNGYEILQKIVNEEDIDVLVNLSLESLYEWIWELENDDISQKISYYTR